MTPGLGEFDLRDCPRTRGFRVFDSQHPALRPADEPSALRVRHLRERAVLDDRGCNFHGAIEPPDCACSARSDIDCVRLPAMVWRNTAHGLVELSNFGTSVGR